MLIKIVFFAAAYYYSQLSSAMAVNNCQFMIEASTVSPVTISTNQNLKSSKLLSSKDLQNAQTDGNNLDSSLSKNDIYKLIKFGISNAPPVMSLKRDDGIQILIINGSKEDLVRKVISDPISGLNGNQMMNFFNEYLDHELPKVYKNDLHETETMLNAIHVANLNFKHNMVLILLLKPTITFEYKTVGGLGFVLSDKGVAELPLYSEIKSLLGNPQLNGSYSSNVVEIVRFGLIKEAIKDKTETSDFFIQLQGIAKHILFNEEELRDGLEVLSFTTNAHLLTYQKMGLNIATKDEVFLEIDMKKRLIGEIKTMSIPE